MLIYQLVLIFGNRAGAKDTPDDSPGGSK